MKIVFVKERIYLIPKTKEDKERLKEAVPEASQVFCWYTLDAGADGNEFALVITH